MNLINKYFKYAAIQIGDPACEIVADGTAIKEAATETYADSSAGNCAFSRRTQGFQCVRLFRHGPQDKRANEVRILTLQDSIVAPLIGEQKIAGNQIAVTFSHHRLRQCFGIRDQIVDTLRIALPTGTQMCFAGIDIGQQQCRARGGCDIVWPQFQRPLICVQRAGQIVSATDDIPQKGPKLGAPWR